MIHIVNWIVTACGSVGDTCSHLDCDNVWVSCWFQ